MRKNNMFIFWMVITVLFTAVTVTAINYYISEMNQKEKRYLVRMSLPSFMVNLPDKDLPELDSVDHQVYVIIRLIETELRRANVTNEKVTKKLASLEYRDLVRNELSLLLLSSNVSHLRDFPHDVRKQFVSDIIDELLNGIEFPLSDQ